MKIIASLSGLVLASAFLAGAANAADNRIIIGPLSSCEEKVVASCEAQYPNNPGAQGECEYQGFKNCSAGGGSVALRGSAAVLGSTTGIYTPPKTTKKPAVVAPKSNLLSKLR